MNSFQDLTADYLSKGEDNQLNAMDELMTDFGQVDIEALRTEIEKNEVVWKSGEERHIQQISKFQTSDNSTAEGRAANKMRSYNLTIDDMLEQLRRLGSEMGGSVFRTEDVEGDDTGGVPSMRDTNFSVEVSDDDGSVDGTNGTDVRVITKTKVANFKHYREVVPRGSIMHHFLFVLHSHSNIHVSARKWAGLSSGRGTSRETTKAACPQ